MPSQTELEFRARAGGQSQNEKLCEYLRANHSRWIPMPELARVITPTGIGAAVHSRISDCRSKWAMNILHRNERQDGRTLSFYQYLPPDHGPDHQIIQ